MPLSNISKNKFLKTLIVVLILGGLFLPIFGNVAHADLDPAQTVAAMSRAAWSAIGVSVPDFSISGFFAGMLSTLTYFLLRFCSLALIISGALLEFILKFTLVEMSTRFSSDGSFASMGTAISDAWGTMRDIANLAFIFVLLYAAIKVILDMNAASIGTTIKNIVIVGLLINFSMFFTKVAVDVSNIATIGFYNAIQAGIKGTSYQLGEYRVEPGLSSAVMNAVNVQTIYGDKSLNNISVGGNKDLKISVIYMMGSIIQIVLAVIFLVVSVMFLARFIIIVLLVITSSAAAVAWMVPGLKKYWDQWKDTLMGQLSFPPAFFLMMWISFKMLYSIRDITGSARNYQYAAIADKPLDVLGLVMNYSLVLGFMVASLIIAKQLASKSTGFTAISAGVGMVGMGGAALASRNSFGRIGRAASQNSWLKGKAATSKVARFALGTANKAATSSYDIRAIGDSKVGKALGAGSLVSGIGKATGKGGFADSVKKKAEAEAKYAKDMLGQTASEKAKAETEKEGIKKAKESQEPQIKAEREMAAREAKANSEAADKARKDHLDTALSTETTKLNTLRSQRRAKEEELQIERTRAGGPRGAIIDSLTKERDSINSSITTQQTEIKEKTEELERSDERYKDLRAKADEAKKVANAAEKKVEDKIEAHEYTPDIQEWQKEVDKLENAGKRRQEEYGAKLASKTAMPAGAAIGAAVGTLAGPLGTVLGAGIGGVAGRFVKGLQGNVEANRKIREGLKKDPKKEAKKALEGLLEDSGEKPSSTGGTTDGGGPAATGGGATPTP